jgi:energy-coupling factor transporter ATPase
VLRFDDITFAYHGSGLDVVALEGVTLAIEPGREVAVLGANGSGKSTLARLANGILLPRAGCVTVDGVDTRDDARAREVRQNVGVVFQHPDDQIVATTVEEDVAFGPENLGLPRAELRIRVDEALAAVGLTGLEHREPHLLSGGQKQRLAIAGALAMRSRYLVLDEPTSMLDPAGRSDVLEVIAAMRSAGHGILHITHDLADVAGADAAIVLRSGGVAFAGTPADLFASPELLAECGLELPPIARLASALLALGAPLEIGLATPAAIAEALWR